MMRISPRAWRFIHRRISEDEENLLLSLVVSIGRQGGRMIDDRHLNEEFKSRLCNMLNVYLIRIRP